MLHFEGQSHDCDDGDSQSVIDTAKPQVDILFCPLRHEGIMMTYLALPVYNKPACFSDHGQVISSLHVSCIIYRHCIVMGTIGPSVKLKTFLLWGSLTFWLRSNTRSKRRHLDLHCILTAHLARPWAESQTVDERGPSIAYLL